jgi:replicative DNA helicase
MGPELLEQIVLGHALVRPECFADFVESVGVDDFANPQHKVLAYAMLQVHNAGSNLPDEDSIAYSSTTYPGVDKNYGGSTYYRSLVESFPTPPESYQFFTDQLKTSTLKRNIAEGAMQKMLASLNNPNSTLTELTESADEIMSMIGSRKAADSRTISAADLANGYMEFLQTRADSPFATTGIPSLDKELTDGFLPTKLTVMAGFTGTGKSTLAINMAHRIAAQGQGVMMFSMESQASSLMDKMIGAITQIPTKRLKKESKSLNMLELGRINEAAKSIAKIPLWINDRASMSMMQMRTEIITQQRAGNTINTVFVDLFGKLEDVDSGENLPQKIQQKCKEMRVLAQELNVHFVLIVQIGRSGYGGRKTGDPVRPNITNIKNANAYAEEADLVFLLHRMKYYKPELIDDILEICVAKQREGDMNTHAFLELFPETGSLQGTEKKPYGYNSLPGSEEEKAA